MNAETMALLAASHPPELDAIAGRVSQATGVSVADILSPKRKQPIARARQLVMWEARRQGASFSEIGRYLARDHTSVIHGVNRIEQLMKELG
jgi:chromosomal replication initiation ATPase DnaA